ncbi:SDR family oxidoreductase [Actinoplanes subtropicus]|uniref:SDR family oxidoreductase n=1 Tax=Actinoplanes subtropicus TaxID=543632 RepID=UPI00055002D8|nr:SDR family oxidoreductase [Actinoplanes subtropicus]
MVYSPGKPVPSRTPLPSALAGSTALLIGGSSGIGLAAGVLLRSVAARVVLVGRDPARLAAAVSQLRAERPAMAAGDGSAPGLAGDGPASNLPGDGPASGLAGDGPASGLAGDGSASGLAGDEAVLGVVGDGGDEATIAAAFERAGHVDHVLVTAGGFSGAGPLTELSADDIRGTVDSRLWPAFAVARAAATRLPAGGSLTFSSGILVLRPGPGMTAPLSLIGAVETLTRALAVELAPARLRVNAVRYGRIDTPLLRSLPGHGSDDEIATAGATTPLGRFGSASEAAAGALFLMANNYVTGQIITVDGGETLN